MALPPTPESPSLSGGGYSPTEGSSAPSIIHQHEAAWVFYPNPALAEKVTVNEAYAKILGIDPGGYIVPDLVTLLAVPGANNVRGEADWPMERLLSFGPDGGYHEVAKDMSIRGTPLLDPMAPIPRELLPAGCSEGGYIRFTVTAHNNRAGRCHHLPWQKMQDQGIGESARLVLDRPGYDAWRVWLVMSRRTPEVNESAVRRLSNRLNERVESRAARAMDKPLTDAQREAVTAVPAAELAATQKAIRATPEIAAKVKSKKAAPDA